jgi:hypothetical protein
VPGPLLPQARVLGSGERPEREAPSADPAEPRGRLRHGGESGPAGRWTYAHRKALRIAAVTLAALIFVFWGHPTAAIVVTIAILLLAVLGLIELIGRPPPRPRPRWLTHGPRP